MLNNRDAIEWLRLAANTSREAVLASVRTRLKKVLLPGATEAAAATPAQYRVSIVLATCDRPRELRRSLESLTSLSTQHQLEILVVDNRPSSPATAEVVRDFPAALLVSEPRQGLSYARNAGFLRATGEIIVCTDDDVMFADDWLERLLEPFRRNDVDVVCGNVLPVALDAPSQLHFEQYGGLGKGYKAFEADQEWFFRDWLRPVHTWSLGATANCAFRARLLRDPDVGMFEEVLGPGVPTGVGEIADDEAPGEAGLERRFRDDRARLHLLSVGQRHRQHTVGILQRAVQRNGLRGYQHSRAELLRLHEGASGQRLARDAGGKSQVVLDARAGASLAAECATVDHDHLQPLGCRVHGGRQSSRSGANDCDVEQFIVCGRVDHTQAARELVFGRRPQQRTIGTDDQDLVGCRTGLLEQRGGIAVLLDIQHAVRMRVPTQEALQPQHVRRLGPTDQHRSAGTGLDQGDATQDHRAHDALAEVRLRDDQFAQLPGQHEQRFDVLLGVAVDQRLLVRELRDLGQELARPLTNDRSDIAEAVTLAYRKASESLLALPRDAKEFWKDGKLREIPGVGKAIAEKIDELLNTGKLQFLENLKKEIPEELATWLTVPSLGPKKVAMIWKTLNITTLTQLETAAKEGKLRSLPGMGAKSESAILEGIASLARPEDLHHGSFQFAEHMSSAICSWLEPAQGDLGTDTLHQKPHFNSEVM
jgi:hypothetical protein